MSDRTTINVPKSTHEEAGDVKDEYEETWSDVLAFYRHFRPQLPDEVPITASVSIGGVGDSSNLTQSDIEQLKNEISMVNDPGVEVDTEEIIGRIEDLEATLPKRVAEELRQ